MSTPKVTRVKVEGETPHAKGPAGKKKNHRDKCYRAVLTVI